MLFWELLAVAIVIVVPLTLVALAQIATERDKLKMVIDSRERIAREERADWEASWPCYCGYGDDDDDLEDEEALEEPGEHQ